MPNTINQCTVFPVVYNYKENSGLKHKSIVFISDSLMRQLLSAPPASSITVVGSMSMISTSTMETRRRTDPLSLTTSRNAECSLPLSFAAHFIYTKRFFERISLIPRIMAPSFPGLTRLSSLLSMALPNGKEHILFRPAENLHLLQDPLHVLQHLDFPSMPFMKQNREIVTHVTSLLSPWLLDASVRQGSVGLGE